MMHCTPNGWHPLYGEELPHCKQSKTVVYWEKLILYTIFLQGVLAKSRTLNAISKQAFVTSSGMLGLGPPSPGSARYGEM